MKLPSCQQNFIPHSSCSSSATGRLTFSLGLVVIFFLSGMASNLLRIHIPTSKPSNPPTPFPISHCKTPFSSHNHHYQRLPHLSFYPPTLIYRPKTRTLLLHSSLSSSSPPASKDEAILQAKTCLSTILEKPLNNLKLTGKLKKTKQPRFRLEIPVVDDSPASLSELAFEVFGDIPIKRKGVSVKVVILWPNIALTESAVEAFKSRSSTQFEHLDISSVTNSDARTLNSAEVVVFFSPESSQLEIMKTVSETSYPKPVVIFNPRWAFEDENGFNELSGFVNSFEVIYSFMGLEVKGILSKRKGVVFKCVRDGVLSGERWNVLVEEEGDLKVVSRFKTRPSISEVENVLYNLMAINSPITKSAKFLKDLVSNVTGKK